MKKSEYLEFLEGCEILSVLFAGVVAVQDGKIWQDGKVIVENPTTKQLAILTREEFNNEFE